uniref:Kelch-like protein 35 n=1 Tax=Pogona vitticeps TaxID=103695 RepID=A0ABM5EKX2_9SAUR
MTSSQQKGQPSLLKTRPLGLKEGLAEIYQEELLYDAMLIADGQRFPCHRALLAAISPYFRDVFTTTWKECKDKEVVLQDVAPSVVQSILKYIYTEDVALTSEAAPLLFAGASRLQIIPLQNICCRFLVTALSMQNWFEMYSLSQVHKNQTLLRGVLQLITQNFDRVVEGDDFLQLDLSSLTALISSSELMVASEYKVYQAVQRWVQKQPAKRHALLPELMLHVRLPLLSPQEQGELQKDLERWKDLKLEWKLLDGEERLRQSQGLREGMYKPSILCIDSQMCEHQEMEHCCMSCYDPQTEMWEKLPGLESLTHACCTSAGDRIYISGGIYKNSYSTAVYEFSSFTNRWAQLPSMATTRAAHAFLFHDQRLYVVGGWRKFQIFLNLAESLDLATGMWAAIAKLPFPLSHPASSVFQDRLYLLGGATGISSHWLFHRGILIYEPRSDVWTQVPLSVGLFAAGAVAMDCGIYVIGGYAEKKRKDSADGTLVPENRYSTRRCFFISGSGKVNRSISIPKLPRGIANAGVVRCGKRIYLLGGEDLTQHYKTIYHWEPGEPRWHRSAMEVPVFREGISRFGCTTLMRPKPHILQLFQAASLVPVAAVCK